jgi:DNA-binding response OmpR family regulator
MPELLLVDRGARAVRRSTVLARQGNLVATSALAQVEEFLRVRTIDVVITEYALTGGTALDVCHFAASAPSCPSVLVTGLAVSQAAETIIAGAQGVLLNPVDTNVLCSRVTRLIRSRAAARGAPPCVSCTSGINQYWSEMSCPRCGAAGVYSFEHLSYRRAWYACTSCRYAWIAARIEPAAPRLSSQTTG